MKTDNGDIYTDFDVALDPQQRRWTRSQLTGAGAGPAQPDGPVQPPKTPAALKERKESQDGMVVKDVRRSRAQRRQDAYGTINGGGPEMQFTTYNGRILIHKK